MAQVAGPDDPTLLGVPWPVKVAGDVVEAPAIDRRGRAFVATTAGELSAVNSAGVRLWSTSLGGELRHTPSLTATEDQQWISVGTTSGILAVANASTGQVLWSRQMPAGITTPVLATLRTPTENQLYAQDSDGALHARSPSATGDWSTGPDVVDGPELALSPSYVPFPGGEKAEIVYGSHGGDLVCLDRRTGAVRSTFAVGTAPVRAVTVQERAIYVGLADGVVAAVSSDCDHADWLVKIDGAVTALTATPSADLAVATTDRLIWMHQNHQMWEEALPVKANPGHGISMDGAGNAYIAAGNTVSGFAPWLTANGSHLAWTVKLPGADAVSAPSIDGSGRLYVPQGQTVHALDDKDGFKLAYTGLAGDVRTLRETYGVVDPARDIELATGSSEPSYARDPSALTWLGDSGPVTFVGNGVAGDAQHFPVGAIQHGPALSQRNDDGQPMLRDRRDYVAYTDTTGGSPTVRFTRMPVGAGTTFTAEDFARSQGISAADAATLVGPGLKTANPTFSPDGRRIAWNECRDTSGNVVVIDLRVTPQVIRTLSMGRKDPDCLTRAVAFSPDSRWLAYHDTVGIAGLELDGPGRFTSVAKAGQRYSDPTWSPDGSQLAVTVSDGSSSWIGALSGRGYGGLGPALAAGAFPSYHLSKFAKPTVDHLGSSSGTPDDVIDVFGRGFDLLHPEANQVWFTHARRSAPLAAQVVGARVDPASGLGVLSVRIPGLAGTGPVTVITAIGRAAVPFVVLPKPLDAVQRRSVPGARIRVFGRGFDLAPAASTRVVFPSSSGTPLYGTVVDGDVSGNGEVLTVVVPDGVVDGPLRTESNVATTLGLGTTCAVAECSFTRLHPRMEISRDDKPLPTYARQVTNGMTLTITMTDIPVDPIFGTGQRVNLAVEPSDDPAAPTWPLLFTVPNRPPRTFFALPASSADTVSAVAAVRFARSTDPAWDHMGDLDLWLNDARQPVRPNGVLRPLARSYLQTPRLDIPIVFVAGTSGTPLNVTAPLVGSYGGEVHGFPAVCLLCNVAAQPGLLTADPATTDPQGPRVWIGPEFLDPHPGIESMLALCSMIIWCSIAFATVFSTLCLSIPIPCVPPFFPNPSVGSGVGYPDLLAFTPSGTPVYPQIGPSAADPVLRSLTLNPILAGIKGFTYLPVYEDLLAFLTGTTSIGNGLVPTDSRGMPLTDAHGAARTRPLGSGSNGVYAFPFDWRIGMPAQATALNAFISGVLARPDVAAVDTDPVRPGRQPIDKVAVVTHSLGGPVARLAYLQRPGLIDQEISFGGAFGGVGKTLKILSMGDDWGVRVPGEFFDNLADAGWGIAFQPWKVQQISANWPTAYDQSINSSTWFDDQGQVRQGRIVNRTLISNPNIVVSNRATLDSYLASVNPMLASAAAGFWAPPGQPGGVALEDFSGGTGTTFHYRVIGEGSATDVGSFTSNGPTMACTGLSILLNPVEWLMECPSRPAWQRAITADGDNTVPYKSAVGVTSAADDRVFVLPAGAMPTPAPGAPAPPGCAQVVAAMTNDVETACTMKHSDLPNYGFSLSLLNDILAGNVSSQPQAAAAGLPFLRQPNTPSPAGVPEDMRLSNVSLPVFGRSADNDAAGPLDVGVRGMVRLRITDGKGRHLGAAPEGAPAPLNEQIPGARYRPMTFLGAIGAGNASVTLPNDQDYDIEMTALARTETELRVDRYGDGLVLPPTDMSAGETVTVHVPKNGGLPRSVQAAALRGKPRTLKLRLLDAAGSTDHAAPHTDATVADGMVTVRAHDYGAGIRDTWLVIDDRPMRYTEPVEIADNASILVWSVDNAGNSESAHGPTGAPGFNDAFVPMSRDHPSVIQVSDDDGREVKADTDASWLDVHVKGDVLELTVDRAQAPALTSVAVVRVSYVGMAPTSLIVALPAR
ncbi:PQQ-binding-like beta-propeller repeat protein [Actinoplanes sp. NPDC049265]|uniref:outer membrane protein assembly factor BamB family protein n=1 Tax=Actinoplanes sp. NPDC049265 TaxID=3363902 RepID=UPI0037153E03